MPKIKLNHFSCKPGCEGQPGDTIDVSAEDAKFLVSRGGGVLVETAVDKAATTAAATAASAETAAPARETAVDKRAARAARAEKR